MQSTMQKPQVRPPENMPPGGSLPSQQMRTSVVGIAFIVAGLAAILAIVTQSVLMGILIVPILGVMFLALGILMERHIAFFIPGGILTGLGIGLLVSQLWLTGAPGNVQGSLPTLGLALGFLAITPLCWYVARVSMVWPLFPGTILLIVGLGVLVGGAYWGEIAGPLALVAFGCYLVFWRATHPSSRLHQRLHERHHSWDTDR